MTHPSIRAHPSIRNVLSIAGSDPSGGAGIQADLKTFAARGAYGMAAITALTAQNTQGVCGVHSVPAEFVAQQIAAVFADVRVDAVKIGMIANGEIADAVAEALRDRSISVVLDPVMIAKGGASLLAQKAVLVLVRHLLPKATLITPNLPEAAALLGESEAADRATMQAQAQKLLGLGAQAVLLKGGHLPGEDSPDVLVYGADTIWLEGKRIHTANTHGTGCSLSSAIAAELAKGLSVADAVVVAKAWLSGAINGADQLEVGTGHGPVHHFHALWPA
ncbi:bifunctional hydroxymethylpyrimidine kinase/phosphomethylpyrimidine kinase [Allorhizobium terrae]|uniref:bifunctional hydroxymethylpyrimidine kinase/phosphomethylpyrimidine kinase n=1 Tax=Allorhizobium terrae TaxID=1848972 RepID=UPI001E422A77|nr:bifunctional hydroxymethylpyrimidine kinase/phosphomethylpyrimidine kinase [Allorhizobium terrae]